MRIHTAHLSLGKQIPRGKGVLFMDATRKSGGSFAQQFIAPSWDLLTSYKRRELTAEEYAVEYIAMLEHHGDKLVALFRSILDNFQPTDLVLACYCGHGEFCHRHLLKHWLVNRLNVESGWELQAGNLYQGDEPVSSIVSVAAPKEVREDLLKYLCVELGNHIVLDVGDDQSKSDVVDDMRIENDLSTAILKKAQGVLVRRQGPLIDLTEFGTLNARRNAYTESVSDVVLGYPTKVDYPWMLVQGDYTACLEYIRQQRFAPTFEITPPVSNIEFDTEMDRLYQYGLSNVRDDYDG